MTLCIGFVGLGNMGSPMARNLVGAGFTLKVFDLVPALVAGVDGATGQTSAGDCAAGVDVFVSMLPAGRHVEALYMGAGGVLERAAPGTLLVDCSTIDAATARKVGAAAAAREFAMLDAPVSGGTGGAAAGTLTFMVGGDALALERARPVLQAMGRNIFHAGANGAGQVAKACNNMLLAVLMAGTAEALALGVRNGLDPAALSEIMKQSSGGNWALNVYNPWPGVMEQAPASRGYSGGFMVDLMNKDLALAMETAEQSGSPVPMGGLARNLYRVLEQTHQAGKLDFSAIQWLFKPDLKPSA